MVFFSYSIVFTPGGTYDGRGLYLADIRIVPNSVSVAWGYNFAVDASVPVIMNTGSQDNPVAAAQILVSWTVDTIVHHDAETRMFQVDGDGNFIVVSDGSDE